MGRSTSDSSSLVLKKWQQRLDYECEDIDSHPKPPPLPAIDFPDLNVEFPDINLNTDLGIVNFKANLRRQHNRQGVPGATGGSVEGQGSFEEVLKHRPDEDQEKEDENERPSDRWGAIYSKGPANFKLTFRLMTDKK